MVYNHPVTLFLLSLTHLLLGKYEFASADSNGLFSGSLIGTPSSWRTMQYTGGLSEIDTILLGNGGGSVWNFEYEKGAFEVEFRCDAFNHFICTLYPAHSHWTCEGNAMSINWGKYCLLGLLIITILTLL